MTPEQQAKLDEMVEQFTVNRDLNAMAMRSQDGEEAFAKWQEDMESSTKDFLETCRSNFHTEPGDHPLLALALTQLLGSGIQHVMTAHSDAPPEDQVSMVMHTVMGTLETIVHSSIQAVLDKKNP